MTELRKSKIPHSSQSGLEWAPLPDGYTGKQYDITILEEILWRSFV
jgi:hypothetical protein